MILPIEYSIVFIIITILLFIITMSMLFNNPDFFRTIAGMIFCFINGIFSYVSAYSMLGVDLYGYTSAGVLVSNPVYDLYGFAVMFLIFVYINLVLLFYSIWLLYKKPWEQVLKVK